MKKIKLTLNVGQIVIFNEMLTYLFNSRRILADLPLEYYVLADFYRRFSLRFMYISDKPFQIQVSEAFALWHIMGTIQWPIPGAGGVATAILWQLSAKFNTGKKALKQ